MKRYGIAVFSAFIGFLALISAQDTAPTVQQAPAPESSTTPAMAEVPAAAPAETPETVPLTEEVAKTQLPANASKRPLRNVFATILNAEISNTKPKIDDENIFDVSKFENNSAWAEITIQITPGRSVSRFDFQLKIGDETCPCLAIAKNDAAYSMDKKGWLIETEAEKSAETTPAGEGTEQKAETAEASAITENTATATPVYVRMLFPVPKNNGKGLPNFSLEQLAQGTIELTDLLKTANTVYQSDSVYFRYMGDEPLSPLNKITPDGICGKTFQELTTPPPAPAAPATETPPQGKAPQP